MKDKQDSAAAKRRRWITLGEILAVTAVGISALTLWDSHRERVRSDEKTEASQSREESDAAIMVLRATPSHDGDRLALTALNPAQAIQAQTILFPSPLGLSPIETTGDPRIEREWFGDAARRARKAAGQEDAPQGDQRLPVVIVTHFLIGGRSHTAHAIHDIGYTLEGRFLRGSEVVLRGLSTVEPVGTAKMQQRLDALWRGRLARSGSPAKG